jgi:hypothetical protein
LLLFFIFNISACKKEKSTEGPTIPSLNSMQMNFSFPGLGTSSATVNGDSSNYFLANTIISYWLNFCNGFNYIPVQALRSCIGKTPTYNAEDSTWSWSNQFLTETNQNYLCNLYGMSIGDSVSWIMDVQQIGENNVYKYFQGISHTTYGWWIIYSPISQSNLEKTASIKINWNKVNQTITYTNIILSDPDSSSYISFNNLQTTDYTDNYQTKILSFPNNTSVNGNTYAISWNADNNSGYISWNNQSNCWNENLINSTCKK